MKGEPGRAFLELLGDHWGQWTLQSVPSYRPTFPAPFCILGNRGSHPPCSP